MKAARERREIDFVAASAAAVVGRSSKTLYLPISRSPETSVCSHSQPALSRCSLALEIVFFLLFVGKTVHWYSLHISRGGRIPNGFIVRTNTHARTHVRTHMHETCQNAIGRASEKFKITSTIAYRFFSLSLGMCRFALIWKLDTVLRTWRRPKTINNTHTYTHTHTRLLDDACLVVLIFPIEESKVKLHKNYTWSECVVLKRAANETNMKTMCETKAKIECVFFCILHLLFEHFPRFVMFCHRMPQLQTPRRDRTLNGTNVWALFESFVFYVCWAVFFTELLTTSTSSFQTHTCVRFFRFRWINTYVRLSHLYVTTSDHTAQFTTHTATQFGWSDAKQLTACVSYNLVVFTHVSQWVVFGCVGWLWMEVIRWNLQIRQNRLSIFFLSHRNGWF